MQISDILMNKQVTSLSPVGLHKHYTDMVEKDYFSSGLPIYSGEVIVRGGDLVDYKTTIGALREAVLAGVVCKGEPTRDDLGDLAINLSVELGYKLTHDKLGASLCKAWQATFSNLEYVGASAKNIYVTGKCKDRELFTSTFKMLCGYDIGVEFVDMTEEVE